MRPAKPGAHDPVSATWWPLDLPDPDMPTLAWSLRYGNVTDVDLRLAGSIVSAYMDLARGANARESLARLRRAAKAAGEPTEGDEQ